jgi:disulfide bond formation protein DsbB
MGGLNATSGDPVVFTAGPTAGTVDLFVNATLNDVTKMAGPVVITINGSTSVALSSVDITPSGPSINTGTTLDLTAIPSCTGGATCPSGVTYAWTISNSLGSLSDVTDSSTQFTAGNDAGTVVVTVTATLNGNTETDQTTITINAVSSGPSAGFLGLSTTSWVLIIVLIAVAAVVVAMLLMMGRKRKETPAEQAPPPQGGQGEAPPWGPPPPQYGYGPSGPPPPAQ